MPLSEMQTYVLCEVFTVVVISLLALTNKTRILSNKKWNYRLYRDNETLLQSNIKGK